MALRAWVVAPDGTDGSVPFDDLAETAAARGGFAWIDLVRPERAELDRVAAELGLHHLLVEDVAKRGQRTKLERYGEVRYLVVHRIVDHAAGAEPPRVEEVHAAIGAGAVVTVTWDDDRWIDGVVERAAAELARIERSPATVVHALLDAVVDELVGRAARLERAVERIEDRMLGDEPPAPRATYRAMRDVIQAHRATAPLGDVVAGVATEVDGEHRELHRHLRDVDDHVRRVASRLEGQRSLLQGMLELAAARVAERQNEHMEEMTSQALEATEQTKRVTGWAAILFAPTLIAGIYGMNFTAMPELHWAFGYPFAIVLMLVFAGGLYVAFKRKRWL